MSNLEARAETIKLARVLYQPDESMGYLQEQPAESLRAFRESVSDTLFDQHRTGFSRLARLSSLLPTGIAATLAEKALGATLAGRVAGEFSPSKAVAIAKKLPTDFLARLTLNLEPRRAEPVVAAMPTDIVVAVALALLERREFISMARFIDVLSDETLEAVMSAMDDDEALLRIGFFVENKPRLDHVVRLLPEDRLYGAIDAAARSDLWTEALALVAHVDDDLKGKLGDIVAEQNDDVLNGLADVAETEQLWGAVLLAISYMAQDNQRRVVNLESTTRAQVLESILRTADSEALWPRLLPLVGLMTPMHRQRVIELMLNQEPELLKKLLFAAKEQSLQAQLLEIVATLPVATQKKLAQSSAELLDAADRQSLLDEARSAASSEQLEVFLQALKTAES